MTIWIYTGGRPSNSAKALSDTLGFKRMITGKSLKPDDTVCNWGTTKALPVHHDFNRVLNDAESVNLAANKYHTFSALAGQKLSTVPWTANMAVAKEWQAEGFTVVCRKVLTGHSGKGIIIVEKGDELVEAPLYTKYIFKVKEFRVHATRDTVIDTQQKVRDPNIEPKCWKVRSHANGFIFQRKNIVASLDRDVLAMVAIDVLGLDFGAVDIVEDKKGNFYILEVNTAPGLEGQSVDLYSNALTELSNAKNA